MKLFDWHHERANAHAVWTTNGGCNSPGLSLHELFSTVVHCVELSNLVAETNTLEEDLDFVSGSGELEIVFSYTEFGKGGGEK